MELITDTKTSDKSMIIVEWVGGTLTFVFFVVMWYQVAVF